MIPPNEGLRPNQEAAVHLGLIVKRELVLLDRPAQVVFHGGARIHRRLQRRREKSHRVAPGRLGLVHGNISLLQNFVRALALIPEDRDPHA